LARLVLLDAAHMQEEEAHNRERKSAGHHTGHENAPLYTTLDALNSFD
jgi:metallo-beta-lactamase family protein